MRQTGWQQVDPYVFVVASLNDEFMWSFRDVCDIVHLEEHRAAFGFNRAFGQKRGQCGLFQCRRIPIDDDGFVGIAHAGDQEVGVEGDAAAILPAIGEEPRWLWPVGR